MREEMERDLVEERSERCGVEEEGEEEEGEEEEEEDVRGTFVSTICVPSFLPFIPPLISP